MIMTEPTTYGEKVAAADAARISLAEPEKPEKVDVDQLMLKIPSKRWFAIRRAMDMTSTEILSDIVAQMTVAANETHRRRTGKDDWSRFLDMGFTDLSLFLGLITQAEADEAMGGDPKSGDGDAVEPHDSAVGGDAVGAAGGRGDAPEGSGAVVSGDGPLDS